MTNHLRQATLDDIDAMVHIHLQAFPAARFFLSRFGRAFLRRYYELVLAYPGGIALVAYRGNTLAGFATGCVDPPSFYAFMRSRRWSLLPSVVMGVIANPLVVVAAARNVLRVMRASRSSMDDPHAAVELTSIASAITGTGVGTSLLLGFVDATRERGQRTIGLTTDADDNASVQHFYERQGFTRRGTVQRGARTLIVYHLDVA
jgi:ribosomal protein S18 acetylase RimI-like enzyme